MRLIFALVWLIASVSAVASPCDGVDQSLPDERKAVLAPIVSKQLASKIDIHSVEVMRSFHFKDWFILYIDPKTADEAFLFYNGDPINHLYLLAWPDAFSENDERQVIRTLLRGKTKGIPRPLAACFAWYVTKGATQR
jgi:hypothetical protein